MNNLSVQLIVNPQCQLVAIDNTNLRDLASTDIDAINDLLEHVSMEFLVYNDEEEIDNSTLVVKQFLHPGDERRNNKTAINFPKDGLFTYYKFLIPKLDHLIKKTDDVIDSVNTKDQIFYYDDTIYYGIKDYELKDDSNIEDIIKDLISDEYAEKVSNYLDIWNYIMSNNATQTFSFQKLVFSVCKLQKCLVNLQRKLIENGDICDEHCQNMSNRYRRDFLLSALYVFDYLKDRGEYDEAQRILDNLTSCSDLCGDYLSTNKDCGCGSTKQ